MIRMHFLNFEIGGHYGEGLSTVGKPATGESDLLQAVVGPVVLNSHGLQAAFQLPAISNLHSSPCDIFNLGVSKKLGPHYRTTLGPK